MGITCPVRGLETGCNIVIMNSTAQSISHGASDGVTKLFILHGWTYEPGTTWAPLLAILKEHGVDAEFLGIPGLSDGSDPVWDIGDYVEWLREKTAGYEKIILWGHSNGGRISMAFAVKYPEKVTRLILEDSAGIPPSRLRKVKRFIFRAVAKIGGMATQSDTLRTLLYKLIRENDYRRATPNMRKTMANLVAFDARTILERIAAPTLIIWGADDLTTPLAAGRAIHQGIRGSRMVIIDSARHSPHITHPERVARLALEFMSS